MSECGVIEFLKGGTISESTILSSRIHSCEIENSELKTCVIKELADIDSPSAFEISKVIAGLPAEQLSVLAKAIYKAFPQVDEQAAPLPMPTVNGAVPTVIHGGRDAMLGTPDRWVDMGEYAVPMYRKGATP